jgi:hypothetical protein
MTIIADELLQQAAAWWASHLIQGNTNGMCFFNQHHNIDKLKESFQQALLKQLQPLQSKTSIHLINLGQGWMSTALSQAAIEAQIKLSCIPEGSMEISQEKGVGFVKDNIFKPLTFSAENNFKKLA